MPTCAPHLAAASQPTKATSEELDSRPTGKASEELDDLEDANSTVQLRGLPFRAKIADIKSFLGEHARNLASDEESPIRLLLNRDGRPSGFARVRFDSPDAAKACCSALHRHEMDDRYVEVLPCSDRKCKTARRARRAAALDAGTEMEETLDPEIEAANQEQLLQEIRAYLSELGRRQSLLSMVGLALSPESRTYLRRVGLGVKHVLARFPQEFYVEGCKGSEQVRLRSGEEDRLAPKVAPWRVVPSGRPTEPSAETKAKKRKAQDQPHPVGGPKRSHAHLHPEEHPGAEVGKEVPMVRLRGLPFIISAQEIFDWFNEHGVLDHIALASDAVKLLKKANGRPSGQAVVQMRSHDDAKEVQEVLNRQVVGDRYIEVFAYGGDGSSTDCPEGRQNRGNPYLTME